MTKQKALNDEIHAWWRAHISLAGTKLPYTQEEAGDIALKIHAIEDDGQRNEILNGFAGRGGFPAELLPKRTLVPAKLGAEWWDPDADKTPTVDAWDLGESWNGWAVPLLTEAGLAQVAEMERTVAAPGERPFVEKREDGRWHLTVIADPDLPEDDDSTGNFHEVLEPTEHTTPAGEALYSLGNASLCWVWIPD